MNRTESSPSSPSAGAVHRVGVVLDGKYELMEEIARGATGAVWQAERLDWRYPVAIKLMTVDTPNARKRFEREICLTVKSRSTHVVQVLDTGFDKATRTPFFTMELLEGESVAHRLERLQRLSPIEVMVMVAHVGRALARAHEAGFVHDDVTPHNIFLVANGNAVSFTLLDFGLAKPFDERATGKFGYRNPDPRPRRVDLRSDLWSLAVVACECLTGRRPFDVRQVPALAALRWGKGAPLVPSSFGEVPPGFDEWFARATVNNVDQSFASARELDEALRAICGVHMRKPLPTIVCEERWQHSFLPDPTPIAQSRDLRRRFLEGPALAVVGFCTGGIVGMVAGDYLLTNFGPPAVAPTPVLVAPVSPSPAPVPTATLGPLSGADAPASTRRSAAGSR